MAILIANGIFKLGVTVKERAVTVLDQKSQEEIKIRATKTADEVASFLNERKKDLMIATIIPASESAFKKFINENKRVLWVKEEGKILQVSAPLYVEMTWIDKSGNEQIKIVNGNLAPKAKLTNVGTPANTTYKSENYFEKAKALNQGEVYVSNLTGWYVNRVDFEKGKRFGGVVRFATPVYGKDGLQGVLQLALDGRHLAAYTDHVIPTSATPVFEADAASGNYAYMADRRGFLISHPNDYHIAGLNEDGTPVPALSKENSETLTKKGQEVLNLLEMGFVDPNVPEVAREALSGKSGIKTYKFGGHTKFVAYAPIKFYTKDFPEPGGFGWIGMGVDVEKFNEMAATTSQNIDKEAKAWTTTIILILIISIVILFLIAAILARGISRSISASIPAGSEGEGPFYDDEDEDK
jgi:hypothetical protein